MGRHRGGHGQVGLCTGSSSLQGWGRPGEGGSAWGMRNLLSDTREGSSRTEI